MRASAGGSWSCMFGRDAAVGHIARVERCVMAQSPLRSARAALSSEARAIEREIAALEARLAQVRDLLQRFEELGDQQPQRTAGSRGRGAVAAGGPTLAGTVRVILRGSRKPLHLDDILDRLTRLGVPSTARNPRASLQTTLYTMAARGEVRNIGANRWERTVGPTADTAEVNG